MSTPVTVGGPVTLTYTRYNPNDLGILDKYLPQRIGVELNNISKSIIQIGESVRQAGAAIPPDWQARVRAIEEEIVDIQSDISTIQTQIVDLQMKQITGTVLIMAAGGDTFTLTALTGYPNISCVVVDLSVGDTALVIPDVGIFDGQEIEIKIKNSDVGGVLTVTTVGGSGVINAGLDDVGLIDYLLPQSLAMTIYSATFKWSAADTAWHVVNTAVR